MVHRIVWRVASAEALEFWKEHLEERGVAAELKEGALLFADPEGLEHELVTDATQDAPLSAASPEIPAEHALLGFDGVRAYSAEPPRSERLLGETLGFARRGGENWEVRGESRGQRLRLRPRPARDQSPPGRRVGAPRRVRVARWTRSRSGARGSPRQARGRRR